MSLARLMRKPFKPFIAVLVLVCVLVVGYVARESWFPLVRPMDAHVSVSQDLSAPEERAKPSTKTILLTDQAIVNLRLDARPVFPQTYWKSIQVPGMIVDRPGWSDRGIITPVTGVVSGIYRFPGETVTPGDRLFSIRLLSESLHTTQSDLFRATQDIALAQAQRNRLDTAGGAIPESRIVEIDNQIARLQIAVIASRRELASRGLTPEQIDHASEGGFVGEITVKAPNPGTNAEPLILQNDSTVEARNPVFEIEELRVEIGHQVQAGQTLCLLANHQSLNIEGRAFRDETILLERSVQHSWPIDVDFQESELKDWPAIDQVFYIRHIANKIDPVNRTFAFQIPLENQLKVVDTGDSSQVLWRFRPGQKVRLKVRVERLDDVFVLPSDAVSRDVADAFIFTQNVNSFERRHVRILAEDRQHTIIANDGSLVVGAFVVQNAAEQLNRMTKAQTGDGLPEGYHVHADGSLHKNEDEGN